MKLNFETSQLINIYYPYGAGGRMLSMTLAQADRILLQDKKLAEAKMKGQLSDKESAQAIIDKLDSKLKSNQHEEWNDTDLSGIEKGFNCTKNEAERDANAIYRTLTNQEHFYFFSCKPDDQGTFIFDTWSRHKCLIIRKADRLLADRSESDTGFQRYNKKAVDAHEFNMDTVFHPDDWQESLSACCDWLDVNISDWDLIEKIRQKFIETYKIGFIYQ